MSRTASIVSVEDGGPNERFAIAYARGEPVAACATYAGISERQAYRLLKRSEVLGMVDELRTAALGTGISRLMTETALAVDTLAELARDARSEHCRVLAASKLLDATATFGMIAAFERRLNALEQGREDQEATERGSSLSDRLATVLTLPPPPRFDDDPPAEGA